MSNHQSSSRKCSTEPTLISSIEKIKKKKKKLQKNPRPRSPLQDYLNIPISSIPRSNSSSLSFSSSVSIEAPSGCLNFFSKTPLNSRSLNRPKPKFLSKNPKSAPNPVQFKENRLTHKSKKPTPCLFQWQSGKRTSSCSTKAARKTKSSPDFDNNKDKCDSGELFSFPEFANARNSDNHVVEDCTPVGKFVSSGSVLKSSIANDDYKSIGERSNTSGTPPVQSSLSPEIQCGSSVLVSGATPSTATCYGAGHVVSGITDRRKCRPRGTLIVGTTSSSEFHETSKDVFDGINDENRVGVVRKSRPSFIPLPAEASMSWNLSPSQEEEGGSTKAEHLLSEFHQSGNLVSSAIRNVPSLPSMYANYSGNSNTDVEGGKKTRITLLSPKAPRELQGCLGGSFSEKVARRPFSGSPCATLVLNREEKTPSRNKFTSETTPFSLDSLDSGNVIQTPKSDSSKERQVGRSWLDEVDDPKDSLDYELDSVSELLEQASLSPETTPFSLDSLDSGNVIQTPKSDLSKERQVGRSWLDEVDDPKDSLDYELDSVSKLLEQASLSPWSQTSPWDPLGLTSILADLTSPCPSKSIGFNQLQKNSDIRASCFSNSTLDDVSESQMRISWRDGLVSRIFETDNLDSCRLLSDEDNEDDGYTNDLLKLNPTKIFTFEAQNEDVQFLNDGLRSPEFLEHEVVVDRKGKALISPSQSNSCAESFVTDGGGLVASGDTDWTLCYKNHLFEEV